MTMKFKYTGESTRDIFEKAALDAFLAKPTETILISYQISEGLGTLQELDRRHFIEGLIGDELRAKDCGFCDGGGQGIVTAEIFCEVNDVTAAQKIIKAICDKYLLDAKISHLRKPTAH